MVRRGLLPIAGLALLASLTCASAQSAAPSPAQSPPTLLSQSGGEARPVTLSVTQSELGVIATALQSRPYHEVAALLVKLQSQIAAQIAPAAEPPK